VAVWGAGTAQVFHFGDFKLDQSQYRLQRGERILRLEGRPMELLFLLVERRGELVTREEVADRLWGTTVFVDIDQSINTAVRKVRMVLRDDPDKPRFIETVVGKGYRFAAPVVTPKESPEEENRADAFKRQPSAVPDHMPIAPVTSDGQSAQAPGVLAVSRTQRWKIVMPLSFLLIAGLLAGGLVWRSRLARHVTEKETVVLGDFANLTGDGVFDGTLRQGLSVQLQQSPFLKLASEEQIHRTLRMMGQEANAPLTPETARAACQRTNSAVALDGSISLIGARYDLILRAVDCASGELLASEEAQAQGKNDVLDTLGRLASEMRGRLGESLGNVQKYNIRLAQVTTPSLDALQSYTLGENTQSQTGNFAASLPFFHRAIEIDPNFAMAYWALGDAYSTLGETDSSAEYMRKAFRLRARVSEREKSAVEGDYYFYATGDLMNARRSFEVYAKIYPDSGYAHNMLTGCSMMLGQYGAALNEAREALHLAPFNTFLYRLVALNYLLSERVEDAVATATEAHAKGLDSDLGAVLYGIAFYRDDTAEMARQGASAIGKPGEEDLLLAMEADTAAYFGHVGNARNFSQRAVVSAERAGEKETAAGYYAVSALREALVGDGYGARQLAATAMRHSSGREVDYGVALALAFAGETNRAQVLTDDLAKRYPEDTIVQFNYLPTLRAKIALSRSNPQQALDILVAADPYELGLPAYSFYNWPNLYPVYVRGEVYLAAHQGGEAATEFRKILDHRGIVLNEPIGALAHLQLGRAYAMEGEISKAKSAYRDFLTLWKDADPDISVLKQAEAEYAKLQ
jgi:DNA-binding winged helix-turn-helix (wHTH) protein/tetratricopeptide (TPR) repeat protein